MKTTTYEKILLSFGLALVSAPLYSKYLSTQTPSASSISLSATENQEAPKMRQASSVSKPVQKIQKTSADDKLNQEYLAYIKSLENQAQTVTTNTSPRNDRYFEGEGSYESDYDYESENSSRYDLAQDEGAQEHSDEDYHYEDEQEVADEGNDYENSEEVAVSSESEDNYVN